MATVGLSRAYVAKYNANGGNPTYSGGTLLAKAVEMNVELESADDNNDYADNEISESDTTFGGGTLTLTTDDLLQEGSALILGITPSAVAGVTPEAKELIYDDDMVPPYLGYGTIVKKIKNGAVKWRAVILPKIKFSVPSDAATTQGETIEWQHPELTAAIYRDDSAKHRWKREATFDSEAGADSYIKKLLNIEGE